MSKSSRYVRLADRHAWDRLDDINFARDDERATRAARHPDARRTDLRHRETNEERRDRILRRDRVCRVGRPGCDVVPTEVIRVAGDRGGNRFVAACQFCAERSQGIGR